jgi:hypothetical protein
VGGDEGHGLSMSSLEGVGGRVAKAAGRPVRWPRAALGALVLSHFVCAPGLCPLPCVPSLYLLISPSLLVAACAAGEH